MGFYVLALSWNLLTSKAEFMLSCTQLYLSMHNVHTHVHSTLQITEREEKKRTHTTNIHTHTNVAVHMLIE